MWNVDLRVCVHAHTNTDAGHATVCASYLQVIKLGEGKIQEGREQSLWSERAKTCKNLSVCYGSKKSSLG